MGPERLGSGSEDAPVLIAGGGLVGLSTAMFLAQHGIPSLAIERLRGGSSLPRAAFFHMRTLEMFRAAGIEERVRRQSEQEFTPEGAVVLMDTISGRQLAAFIPSLNEGVEALSPCRRLFVSQPGLEPILRARATEAGARVLEGSEVVGIEQDGDGVTVTARDVDSGAERRLRGRYLIGADGAHSKVRELLDIPLDGRGVFSNSLTIYFHADLSPYMAGKSVSIIYIGNPALGGFFRLAKDSQSGFLVINTVGDTSRPEAANPAADVSPETLVRHVRAAAGVPDLAVQIDGFARWRATSDVARRYADRRVFLAGDAVHLMPPNGGYGGNTGIHDGHNLAWKLALVLKGIAGPELLSTYEIERRPVGKFTVEQAYTRYVTRTAAYLGAKDYQPQANDFDIEIGYLYRSSAVVPEDESQGGDGDGDGAPAPAPPLTAAEVAAGICQHEDPRRSFGRPGSRAPHVWLEQDARPLSTLDLCGRGLVLLAAPGGGAWCAAARDSARRFPGLPLEIHHIGAGALRDPGGAFAAAYGLPPEGATLIRPDGFVAWRGRSAAPAAEAETILAAAIGAVIAA